MNRTHACSNLKLHLNVSTYCLSTSASDEYLLGCSVSDAVITCRHRISVLGLGDSVNGLVHRQSPSRGTLAGRGNVMCHVTHAHHLDVSMDVAADTGAGHQPRTRNAPEIENHIADSSSTLFGIDVSRRVGHGWARHRMSGSAASKAVYAASKFGHRGIRLYEAPASPTCRRNKELWACSECGPTTWRRSFEAVSTGLCARCRHAAHPVSHLIKVFWYSVVRSVVLRGRCFLARSWLLGGAGHWF